MLSVCLYIPFLTWFFNQSRGLCKEKSGNSVTLLKIREYLGIQEETLILGVLRGKRVFLIDFKKKLLIKKSMWNNFYQKCKNTCRKEKEMIYL